MPLLKSLRLISWSSNVESHPDFGPQSVSI